MKTFTHYSNIWEGSVIENYHKSIPLKINNLKDNNHKFQRIHNR